MENYSDDIGSGCSLQAEDDYGELLKLHARLRRYAISLAGYGDAADELLQDALLHIMLQLNKYEPYGSFYAWASKLMHNSFVNIVNRKQTYSRIITELGKRYSMQTEPSMSPDAENLYCADEILRVIDRLPMRQRQVVDLRLCGYKYNDIAEELGTSVGNVKNSMFLARNNIRRMLEE